MKQKMYIFLAVMALMLTVNCNLATAQVAIGGNGSVEPGAVLDLSQQGNATGGLLLPKVTALPAAGSDLRKAGMLIYYDGKVYFYDANTNQWIVGINANQLSAYATKVELNSGLGAKQNSLIAGDGITISDNTIASTVTQGPAGPQGAPGPEGPKGNDGPQGPEGPAFDTPASASNAGLMSAADKAKLDGLSNILNPPSQYVYGTDGHWYTLSSNSVFFTASSASCPNGYSVALMPSGECSAFIPLSGLIPEGEQSVNFWPYINATSAARRVSPSSSGGIVIVAETSKTLRFPALCRSN
ncbi:hypothetical protein FACS189437_04840 [Bacteroidia bacterium]|nr:hypothetical protein FACS189437_04840 [Bacteroidia bacterium]